MKRRSFLKGLLATATIPLVAKAHISQEPEKYSWQFVSNPILNKDIWAEGEIKIDLEPDNKQFIGNGPIIFTFEGENWPDGSLEQFIVTDTNECS